jgi:hypothetical protein
MTEEERAQQTLALRELGCALYGSDWVQPMGRALGVSPRTAQRFAVGQGDLPTPGMLAEVARAAIVRGEDVALLERALVIRRFAGTTK